MAWVEGLTNSGRLLKDLANILCTANKDEANVPDETKNWSLIYPTPYLTVEVLDEVLVADVDDLIFTTSQIELIDNGTLIVKKDSDGSIIDNGEYTVNFETGSITFMTPKLDVLRANYNYKKDHKLTTGLAKIDNRIVLKTTTTEIIPDLTDDPYGTNTDSQVSKITMYLEIIQPAKVNNLETGEDDESCDNYYYVNCRIFDQWNLLTEQPAENIYDVDTGNIIHFNSHISEWARFSWYRDYAEQLIDSMPDEPVPDPESNDITDGVKYVKIPHAGIFSDLTIQFYIATNNDRIAMVLVGDPTLNYDNYLISFAYIGRIDSFEDSVNDTAGNFALTTGSSSVPCIPNGVVRDPLYGNIVDIKYPNYWGDYAATGVSDICMFKTRNDAHFQRHYVSFITTEEEMQKDAFNPSRWTNRFHLSPAYVVHGYDGYRGWLNNVVIVDDSSIIHLDKMIINKDSTDPDKPEEIYRYFKVNAPFSFLTNTPNFHCGIGIKEA